MIEQIKIKHFKKLRDAELHFAPISLLIGGNNSAKSTVFKAFNFLKAFFNGQKDNEFTLAGGDYKTFDFVNLITHSYRQGMNTLENRNLNSRSLTKHNEFSFEFCSKDKERQLFVFGLPSQGRQRSVRGSTVVLKKIIVFNPNGQVISIERSSRGASNVLYPNIKNIYTQIQKSIQIANDDGKTIMDVEVIDDRSYRSVQNEFVMKVIGGYKITSEDGEIKPRMDKDSSIFFGSESGFAFFYLKLKSDFPKKDILKLKKSMLVFEQEVFELVLEEINLGCIKIPKGASFTKELRLQLSKLISKKIRKVKAYTKNRALKSFFKNYSLNTVNSIKKVHYDYDSQVDYYSFKSRNNNTPLEFHLYTFIESYFFAALRDQYAKYRDIQLQTQRKLNNDLNYIQIERNRDNLDFYNREFHSHLESFFHLMKNCLFVDNRFRGIQRGFRSDIHRLFQSSIKDGLTFEESMRLLRAEIDKLSYEHFQKILKDESYESIRFYERWVFGRSLLYAKKASARDIRVGIEDFKSDTFLSWEENSIKLKAYFHLLKWIGRDKFDIADEMGISRVSESFGLDIYKSREKIGLKDIGFGTSQLIGVLFKITQTISEKNQNAQIMIEEPESNLHPDYQIMLAHMIMDYSESFGLSFIIETHSEYMLREFQLMVKRDDNSITKDKVNVNFGVDGVFTNVTINDKGLLSQSIAKNFYGKTAEQMREFHSLNDKNR